jgi:hypothetical protein
MDNVLVFLMGDLVEAIDPLDPRFDFESIDGISKTNLGEIIGNEYDRVLKMLKPIADKILLIHTGNHELRVRKKHFHDIPLDLCRVLRRESNPEYTEGDPPFYGRYATITRLRFEHETGGCIRTIDILTSHGTGGGRKKGGKINLIQDISGDYEGLSIVAMGHNHEQVVFPQPKLSLRRWGKLSLAEHDRLLMFTGSYLKTYNQDVDNYTEQRMYPPTPLGAVGVNVSIVGYVNKKDRKKIALEGFYL